jgi:hypothetical protein
MCRWRLIGCGLLAVSGLALLVGAAPHENLKAAEKVLARHIILVRRGAGDDRRQQRYIT